MTEKTVLSWSESTKHHVALNDIEEKHLPDYLIDKIGNSQLKKLKAKVHNEQQEYLKKHNIKENGQGLFIKVKQSF